MGYMVILDPGVLGDFIELRLNPGAVPGSTYGFTQSSR